MNATYVYVITKQADLSESSKGWAELELTPGGVPYVQAYRTEDEARQRMLAMIPEGKDPWNYAGLRVEKEVNRGMFVV